MMLYVFLMIPVALLVGTVAYAVYSVKKGKSPKKALSMQLLSFLAIAVLSELRNYINSLQQFMCLLWSTSTAVTLMIKSG